MMMGGEKMRERERGVLKWVRYGGEVGWKYRRVRVCCVGGEWEKEENVG